MIVNLYSAHCRCVLRTLRQCCRSVLLPMCLATEVSVKRLLVTSVHFEQIRPVWNSGTAFHTSTDEKQKILFRM